MNLTLGNCLFLVSLGALLGACSSDDSPTQTGGGPQTPALPQPKAEFVPKPTGECPGFADGAGCTSDATSLICTFSPAGLVPRPVRIWMGDGARQKPGPIVVFWHGLSRNAGDAALPLAGLGPDVVNDIVAKGGIVASPERSEKRQTTSVGMLPWLIALGAGEEDDLFVMDEVIACANQVIKIDLRHIHTCGMSAGGLQTGAVNPRRSGYLASTAVFSGGQVGAAPPEQDPENLFPVFQSHGGPNDMVVLNFQQTQTDYHQRLIDSGHYALLCNHGMNHTVPPEVAAGAWQFMQDHPFGVKPEPYADGIPDTIPDYCVP